MYGKLKVKDPNKLVYEVTITATVDEWEELKDQLVEGKWPSSRLQSIILDVLLQARNVYFAETEGLK